MESEVAFIDISYVEKSMMKNKIMIGYRFLSKLLQIGKNLCWYILISVMNWLVMKMMTKFIDDEDAGGLGLGLFVADSLELVINRQLSSDRRFRTAFLKK